MLYAMADRVVDGSKSQELIDKMDEIKLWESCFLMHAL
jgi:hypothetical protein